LITLTLSLSCTVLFTIYLTTENCTTSVYSSWEALCQVPALYCRAGGTGGAGGAIAPPIFASSSTFWPSGGPVLCPAESNNDSYHTKNGYLCTCRLLKITNFCQKMLFRWKIWEVHHTISKILLNILSPTDLAWFLLKFLM
jgi:hypothetical protein